MKLFANSRIYSNSYTIVLLLIVFSLPYSIHITSILIILLGALWLLQGDLLHKLNNVLNNKVSLLFISLYILYLFSVLFTESKGVGLPILETKLSLLIFPLILFSSKVDSDTFNKILLTFVLSCLIASIVSFLHALKYVDFNGPLLSAINPNALNRDNLSSLLKIHPTYFSIYLFFSIIIIHYFLSKYWKELTVFYKILLWFLIIYFFLFNIFLSSRMPIIAFVVIAVMLTIRAIFILKRTLLTLALVASLSVFGLYFFNISVSSQRFNEIIETPFQPPRGIHHNSTNLRIGQLVCTYDLLKDNWLLGVGPGNMQNKLNVCYTNNDFSDKLAVDSQNPHNQFLQTWLELGIFGLLLLLTTLFIPAIMAWHEGKYLYLYFIIFFSLCCLTESVLATQKGIIFYAFFNSLLAFHYPTGGNSDCIEFQAG
jgi:O-antigen ligase